MPIAPFLGCPSMFVCMLMRGGAASARLGRAFVFICMPWAFCPPPFPLLCSEIGNETGWRKKRKKKQTKRISLDRNDRTEEKEELYYGSELEKGKLSVNCDGSGK